MSDHEPLDANKVKHLELIQNVIGRLANNSFLIKGWSLTVEAAILAYLTSHLRWKIAAVSFVPLLFFWLLDGYYLKQERLFRHLYNDVRLPDGKPGSFDMNVSRYHSKEHLLKTAASMSLRYFYGGLFVTNVIFLMGALGLLPH